LFVNDLLSEIRVDNHAYADDTTIYGSTSYKRAPRTKQRTDDMTTLQESLQHDIDKITEWGDRNDVKFNPNKTKVIMINLLRTPLDPELKMEGVRLGMEEHLDVLGISITQSLSWRLHILSMVEAAARKLGALFRTAQFFTAKQLAGIYKSNIRPCLEYCSHIWGGSSSVWMLEKVDRRARRLIGDPMILGALQPLQHRRDVAALTILFRIYHGRCSAELHSTLPPLRRRGRPTRAGARDHDHSLTPFSCRIERFKRSFLPRTIEAWNNLPEHVFPADNDTNKFKKKLNDFFVRVDHLP
jgi:hypothetical protein